MRSSPCILISPRRENIITTNIFLHEYRDDPLAITPVFFTIFISISKFILELEKNMHDGPKVLIKSTALEHQPQHHQAISSRQKNSDLHEIYLAPYRYVSRIDLYNIYIYLSLMRMDDDDLI